jgi:hypothetical protein
MATPHAIDPMCASLAVIPDPRRQHPTTRHALETSLTMARLATICGAHHWVELAPWGPAPHPWLAAFLAWPQGLPSHETCGRVLA